MLVGTDIILDLNRISILLIHPLHTSSFQMRALLFQCKILSRCSSFSLCLLSGHNSEMGLEVTDPVILQLSKIKRRKDESKKMQGAQICLCSQT